MCVCFRIVHGDYGRKHEGGQVFERPVEATTSRQRHKDRKGRSANGRETRRHSDRVTERPQGERRAVDVKLYRVTTRKEFS